MIVLSQHNHLGRDIGLTLDVLFTGQSAPEEPYAGKEDEEKANHGDCRRAAEPPGPESSPSWRRWLERQVGSPKSIALCVELHSLKLFHVAHHRRHSGQAIGDFIDAAWVRSECWTQTGSSVNAFNVDY